MALIEIIVVGLLTLTGVVVGAILNYFLLERSKRKENEIDVREDLLECLDDMFSAFSRIHSIILQFRNMPDTGGLLVPGIAMLAHADSSLTSTHRGFFKSWNRARLHKTDIELKKFVAEMDKEWLEFEEMYSETFKIPHGEAKLFDVEFNDKLVAKLNLIYRKIDEIRNKILGLVG